VFQRGSGTPPRTERNPLKSRTKTLHWGGPDRAPTGTPLSLAFYCYVNALNGILWGSYLVAETQGHLSDACERRQKRATEARASIAIEKARAASRLRALTGEGRNTSGRYGERHRGTGYDGENATLNKTGNHGFLRAAQRLEVSRAPLDRGLNAVSLRLFCCFIQGV
jgi:hypothetical protein